MPDLFDNPEEKSEDLELLQEASKYIRTRFDAVQIVATRFDEGTGDTFRCAEGEGNLYSRIGIVREWLVVQDERIKENVRAEQKD